MARACGRPRRAAPTSNQLVHSLSVIGVWGRNDRVSFHHGDTGHEKKSEKRHFCTCKSLKIKGRIFQISIFSHVHGEHGVSRRSRAATNLLVTGSEPSLTVGLLTDRARRRVGSPPVREGSKILP